MKRLTLILVLLSFMLAGVCQGWAAPFRKLEKPPLGEQWFGIYVDNERVGFYRQAISETADGYRMECDGSVQMKVMGVAKESSMRETYLVARNLTLRSLEVEQTINGVSSRLTGKLTDSGLRVKNESGGRIAEKQIRFRGELFPGPSLNIFPLMRDVSPGRTYKTTTFDAEEVKIKDVKISIIGEEKTPDGRPALRMRNNLYFVVDNDIWVDHQGNTLLESVRDGLVTTRAEDPKLLGAFVGGLAISKKDLIYDFSMVRVAPPIQNPGKLSGLAVELSGWNDALPLPQGAGQSVENKGAGRIVFRTGVLAPPPSAVAPGGTAKVEPPPEPYLKAAVKIESDAPEIVAKAKELAAGKKDAGETVRALAAWTAEWLKDTVEDGGGALESLKARSGNCQTHARLYTALSRAAGIPTRFVSGLVYQEGKGFLYHSWAESLLGDAWVAVDPTYNQVPADPTHLKFFEGHTPDDLIPIIAIIGRIRIEVLETKY